MKNFTNLKRSQLGQGMTEYIIIVALIAVAAIGTYGLFGETLRNQVSGLASELGGNSSATNIASAKTSAEKAETLAKEEYNLSNYDKGAAQE